MEKKKILVITPPTEFMVYDRFRTCLRFSAIGGNLITSMIDKNQYDVNYYDIDAYMIKNFNHISKYFNSELDLMHELKYYLKKEPGKKHSFFSNLTKLINIIISPTFYNYILCSLPCYGNSVQDCENQMRMAAIIIRSLKETKGTPITVAGGNWWENLDIDYWKNNVVDPTQIIDFLIFGSMQIDELDDLLETGYAQKAYHKNPEKGLDKSYTGPVGKGKLFGKGLNNWGGYYKFNPEENLNWDVGLQIPDQEFFINRSDLRYTFKEVFDFYKVKSPENNLTNNHYIQQGSMFFTDGCVGCCSFCETGDKPFKSMPLELIGDMIKKYVYDWGYNCLFFKNSAINPTRKFAEQFCNWLIKENLNILWSDSARFHNTDSDFFDMVWESGCRSLGWGCESVNNQMLKYINKGINVDQITTSLALSHNKGIWNIMNFIFGMPGETEIAIEDTIQWIKDNSLFMDECHYNEYCVKPNSPFYLYPEKYGLVKENNNVFDPKLGLNSEQTFSYRNRLRSFVMKNLSEFKRLEVHTSQILTFPLYQLFNHDKLKVREWMNSYYAPYKDQIGG